MNQACNVNADHAEELLEGHEKLGVWQRLSSVVASFLQAALRTWIQIPSIFLIICTALVSRSFEEFGSMEDLEEVIPHDRQSLDHKSPDGHIPPTSDRSHFSEDILHAVLDHTVRAGSTIMNSTNDEFIYYLDLLARCPPSYPNRSNLEDLANSIRWRFDQTRQAEDSEKAIAYHRHPLDPHSVGHPDSFSWSNDLASSVLTRLKQTGQAVGLEEATTCFRQSLHLHPIGHPDRSDSLSNLATATLLRFQYTGKTDDLDDAAKHLSHAETSLPIYHPVRASIWSRLAAIFLERHNLNPSDEHLSKAFTLYECSVNHHAASLMTRFHVALEWASAARLHRHESVLHAYSTLLTLLCRQVVAATTIEQKFVVSAAAKSLAMDAASSAIEVGQPETAIEFLEQGRTIIFSAMQSLRHPLDKLRAVDRGLADEFEILSAQLECLAMATGSERETDGFQVTSEAQQRKQRILSKRWGEVVDRIRRVKGFENFLQAVPFETLRKAAAGGPVIVVNISQYRSDAIIVRDVGPPVVIPLPMASPNNLARLSSKFSDPRASSKASFSKDLCSILRVLWDIIVGPVTDQLAALGMVENTRIWWCPTSHLCAFPLHAAGPYRLGKKSLPDLYISSYTPTLSALIAARSGIAPRTTAPNLLAIGDIGQPDSLMPNVEEELCRIMSFGEFVNVLFGEAASRDNVMSGLPLHSWVHFACHGDRDPQPFHSSLQIYAGERLKLLDLVKGRLPNAEFAFLSACHSAASDINGAPDEAIHLAGVLQFCGFRSVVGSMWAVADTDGPDLAADFYQYMFRETGNVADFMDSAKALNVATRKMRMRKGMTIDRWVTFVHIGA